MVESLKEILEKKFKKHPVLGELIREKSIKKSWPEMVGQRLAAAAWPVSLKKGLMTVAVTNPAWHQEINFIKEKIIAEINKFVGGNFIKSLKCQVIGEREFEEIKNVPPETEVQPQWYVPAQKTPAASLKTQISRLGMMDDQLKKWRRAGRIKNCPVCGRTYSIRASLCPACRSSEKTRVFQKIARLVLQHPDKSLGQLKKLWPDLKTAEFKKARQLILEEGEKLIRFFKSEKEKTGSFKKIVNYKDRLLAYLILRTGQPPAKMERNLLKKILGDKIYYHLKNSLF